MQPGEKCSYTHSEKAENERRPPRANAAVQQEPPVEVGPAAKQAPEPKAKTKVIKTLHPNALVRFCSSSSTVRPTMLPLFLEVLLRLVFLYDRGQGCPAF